MSAGTVAAVPVDLLVLPGRTHEPDLVARSAAARVGGSLGAAVATHIDRSRALSARAEAVGLAFLAAGGPAGAVALGLTALGRTSPIDAGAAADALAAVLGVPLVADDVVRRPDVAPMPIAWLAAAIGPATMAVLARTHPHLVGPVDGMPLPLRYEANRILAGGRWGDRQLLFVDPERALAAEVLGDVASADHVAVVVPGMGNTLERFDIVVAKAEALRSAAAALDPPESLATVAWLGYESPGVPEVVLDDAARVGAPDLVRLLSGLALAAPAATRTVIGHSYGSLVAGTALREGLDADAVVLTGSPGVRAETAAELGDTPVYALRAPGDYVAWSEHFGPDPTGPDFGATRLSTGGVAGHAGYFDEGTASLRNLALVAVGRAGEATVVRPSRVELAVDAIDDLHELVVEASTDRAQDAARAVAGTASWCTDEVERLLPAPVAGAVDEGQHISGQLLEVGNGFVDLTQRLASPDLVGDVVGDTWDALFN